MNKAQRADGLYYGRLTRKGKSMPAHKYMYEKKHGQVPEGMELDHLCRVTLCVNPDHLEAVTHTQNMRRASNTRLTMDIANEIRDDYAQGATQVQIAKEYNISQEHTSRIILGKSWKS